MNFVKEKTENIGSSIFWDQLRKEFATRFIEGKAEVIGWRGNIYDPRVGDYNKSIRKIDNVYMFLSKAANYLSGRLFSMVSARARYEKAYIKLGFDKELPQETRLYTHSILKAGENCAIHPHILRMLSYFSQLFKYCSKLNNNNNILEIGGGAYWEYYLITNSGQDTL